MLRTHSIHFHSLTHSLPLIEPEVVIRDTQSERSSTALLHDDDDNNAGRGRSLGEQAKEVWQKLKDEEKERKDQRVQHVSHADATKMTGYGEDGPKSNAKDGKGDTRSLGALFFG